MNQTDVLAIYSCRYVGGQSPPNRLHRRLREEQWTKMGDLTNVYRKRMTDNDAQHQERVQRLLFEHIDNGVDGARCEYVNFKSGPTE